MLAPCSGGAQMQDTYLLAEGVAASDPNDLEEFLRVCETPKVQEKFKLLEVPIDEAGELFQIKNLRHPYVVLP